MARIVKEFDERFDEFLDAAQALFFGKGYEQTSVQDIITHIGVAKGTFYHYFESKADLLDAVIKRSRKRILATVMPIVDDTEHGALTRFAHFFREIGSWKLDNKDMILTTLRMLYKDDNVLLRLKSQEETRQTMAAPLAQIIEAGVTEGTFNVRFAHETAELVLRMCEMPSQGFVGALLDGAYDAERVEVIKRELHVFNRSIERVLGMAEYSFDMVTDEDLADWLSVLDRFAVNKTH